MKSIRKPKFIILCGLPGSGKSFWAKQYQKENPATVRLNNDELRETLFGRVFDVNDTKILNNLRTRMEDGLIQLKKDIIIDNTNVNRNIHAYYFEVISKGYELIIKDFSKVPLELCLQRNKDRGREVPESVILSMKESLDDLINEFYTIPLIREKVTFW